jgi:peroxiredoxin
MTLARRASPLVVLALIIVIALLAAWWLPSKLPAPPPELRFTLLDGRVLTLAELRGRPVLLAFWATSCVPCIQELPDLIQLYRELRPRGLELVGVAMPYDPPLHVQMLVRKHQVPYPIALDVSGQITRAFDGVSFIPTAYLLDPQGRIIDRHVGKLDIERARRLIAPFLSDAAATDARAPRQSI